MIYGRDTLGTIENALRQEQNQLNDINNHIADASNRLIKLRTAQAADFKELASLKVGVLASGEISTRIDRVEKQVLKRLDTREQSIVNVDKAIEKSKLAAKPLAKEHAAQTAHVEQAAMILDSAEAATQQRLDADPVYQQQRDATQEAQRIAIHANDKAEQSAQELDTKGQPYKEDTLFIYLWERHYAEAAYHANPLVRYLDSLVAKLIDYSDARPNYFRLQEIPKRLREHADGVQTEATAEFEKLRDWDNKALQEDGVVDLESKLSAEKNKLEKIDQRIDKSEEKLQQQLQQQTDFATGEDQEYQQVVNYLSTELVRDDLQELRQEAFATPFPEDDEIVEKLMDREEEQYNLEQLQADLKTGIRDQQQRLREIELLRREFRQNGFDQVGSSFVDGALVSMSLSNFLNGSLSRTELLHIFQRQQRFVRYRSNPRFGSGGFGRGTVWGGNIDFPSSGRGGFGGGSGGFGGGGGFSSGGGFGGSDGFSSGGGF